MTRPGIHLVLFVAVALAGATAGDPVAAPDDYKVVVNPGNPITAVDRGFLREAYLRRAVDWTSGEPIRPIDLATRFAVRERFVIDVLKKTPAQLKRYWNQQIFSGKGVPPPEAESTAAAVAYVLGNPGAVAYLPRDADTGRAKVIGVK
jgi:hypothetical protein